MIYTYNHSKKLLIPATGEPLTTTGFSETDDGKEFGEGEDFKIMSKTCGVTCFPGDDECNNYCNKAPQKGKMQDYPKLFAVPVEASKDYKLGDKVKHKIDAAPFIVVGIRENEIEIKGDWSGGVRPCDVASWVKYDEIKPFDYSKMQTYDKSGNRIPLSRNKETIRIPLKNIEGSMTVSKNAGQETIDAVNRMAELAYNMPPSSIHLSSDCNDENKSIEDVQAATWEMIDEIKEDESPYAALSHIKHNYYLIKK